MKAEEEPKRFFFRIFGVWQKKIQKTIDNLEILM